MGRKYVFFDIDNTLVSYSGGVSHIPSKTRDALRLLRDNGHIAAVATGRSIFLTHLVAKDLSIDTLICAGGADIFCCDERIHQAWLPDAVTTELKRFALSRKDAISAAVDDRFIYSSHSAVEEWRKYFFKQAGYDCLRAIGELRRASIGYLMTPPPLSGDYGVFTSPPPGVIVEHMRNFVELRPSGATKWRGITRVLQHLGASESDVVTFGDGPNDVEMLSRSPISAAVESACDDAKAAATLVTDDIDAGGIFKACAQLGLI